MTKENSNLKETTIHDISMEAIDSIESRISLLNLSIKGLIEKHGDKVHVNSPDYFKYDRELNNLNMKLEKLYQKELLSNIDGVVTETKFNRDNSFTVVVIDKNLKKHTYKGLNKLDVAVAQKISLGEKLGEINKSLYYGVE